MNFYLFLLLVSVALGIITAVAIKDQSTRLKTFGIVLVLYLIGGFLAKQEIGFSIVLFVICFFCPYSTVIMFQQKRQRKQEKLANRNNQ